MTSKRKDIKIVERILDEEGIQLPLAILKNKMLKELEESFSKKNPLIVAGTYRKIAENLDEYIETKRIEEIVDQIKIKMLTELQSRK